MESLLCVENHFFIIFIPVECVVILWSVIEVHKFLSFVTNFVWSPYFTVFTVFFPSFPFMSFIIIFFSHKNPLLVPRHHVLFRFYFYNCWFKYSQPICREGKGERQMIGLWKVRDGNGFFRTYPTVRC